MTHISGNLIWSDAIYEKHERTASQITMTLSDGTIRYMNFKNWDMDAEETYRKLEKLTSKQKILFATWGGYDEKIWFCDVKACQ